MIVNIRIEAIAIGVFSAALLITRASAAQSSAGSEKPYNFETRAELEAQLKTAEAKGDKQQAYLIHYRLERGDFQDGDRVVIRMVRGASVVFDTLTVRNGKQLQLTQVGDLSLAGVLRSELVPALTAHLAKFIRDPVVQATPLVRVGILGMVGRPGFYYASADIPLSDVLMSAGGPNGIADLGKIEVKREGEIIIDKKNSAVALREGMSMDFLHMQAGDEISVGQQRSFPWPIVIPVASTLIGLYFAYGRGHH